MYLGEDTQKLLLSAVIPNAVQINDWFTDGEGVVDAKGVPGSMCGKCVMAIICNSYHDGHPY
jgi:hypothetical protein